MDNTGEDLSKKLKSASESSQKNIITNQLKDLTKKYKDLDNDLK